MEQNPPSRIRKRLDDPAAARAVMDPAARRFLAPFVARERTVSSVARELGVDMSSVLYRVRQFLRLGLLEVARVERRRGRAIKHYRSVADSFFVPFHATTLEAEEALSSEAFAVVRTALDDAIGRAWLQAAGAGRRLGVHVFRSASGATLMDVVPEEEREPSRFFASLLELDAPAVWDSWWSLQLAHVDAKTLQREMASLLGRYRARAPEEGGREYLVRVAMAPGDA